MNDEDKNKPSKVMKMGLTAVGVMYILNSIFMVCLFISTYYLFHSHSKLPADFNFGKFMSQYYINQSNWLNVWLFGLTIALAVIGIISSIEFRAKIEEMDKKKQEMDKIIQKSKTEIAVNKSKMEKMNKTIEEVKNEIKSNEFKMAEDLKEVKEYVKKAKESEKLSEFYSWYSQGLEAGKDDKLKEAIDYYTKAIELNTKAEVNPRLGNTYNNRGFAYYKLNKYDDAEADLKNAIKLIPDSSYPYYNLTKVYILTKKLNKAFKTLNMFIEKESKPFIYNDDYELWIRTLQESDDKENSKEMINLINQKLEKKARKKPRE